jgi:hypothetical protein
MRAFLLMLLSELVVGCVGSPVPPPQLPVHLLTEEQAVRRAEEFVRANGYVRREDADPRRLQVERSLTYGTTIEELLRQREGTLLPEACGVMAQAVLGFDRGWSVVFCYNPAHPVWREGGAAWKDSIRERSRVVVMDEHGADVFIPHPDFGLVGPGIKRLPGLDELDRLLGSAQQGGAADAAAPGR